MIIIIMIIIMIIERIRLVGSISQSCEATLQMYSES